MPDVSQLGCFGAPAAPTSGVSQKDLNKVAQDNAEEARTHRSLFRLFWFRSQVRNGGPWDYKQVDSSLQDFGNYNYGRSGGAMGIALDFLLGQAGRAQEAAGTSDPAFGSPGLLGFASLGGTGSNGDDPRDQEMIL
ncbi:hypothetical protein LTR94_033233, partial [Friedmanniomyces endolithicus]